MNDLPTPSPDFREILDLIASARQRAYQVVNTALIDLYWQVGEHLSRKIASAEWGVGVVPQLSRHIATTYPGLRGFTRSNLLRMRQFYETYCDCPIVAPLPRQLPNSSAPTGHSTPAQGNALGIPVYHIQPALKGRPNRCLSLSPASTSTWFSAPKTANISSPTTCAPSSTPSLGHRPRSHAHNKSQRPEGAIQASPGQRPASPAHNKIRRPEGATYDSPGHRPGSVAIPIFQALKGRFNP